MPEEKIITGKTEEEIWQKIKKDLGADVMEYKATIKHQRKEIMLGIDIDPGGGFEGGYATTMFRSALKKNTRLRFGIHRDGLLDEIGKFLGMQHVKIGVPEFDKKIIIKTNNEVKVKNVFSDRSAREVFKRLDNFTLGITKHAGDDNEKIPFLELIIEEGITDAKQLQKIYHAFFYYSFARGFFKVIKLTSCKDGNSLKPLRWQQRV